MVILEDLKHEAVKALKTGKVKYIIGYQDGSDQYKAIPAFLREPDDVEKLVWNPSCVHNLTKFLVDDSRRKKREREPDERQVGIVVKGCDSRAINVLIQEKFIKRDDVYIIGVSCESNGVVDEKKLVNKLKGKKAQKIEYAKDGQFLVTTKDGIINIPADEVLAERCLECKANYPVVYDIFLGDKEKKKIDDPYKSVQKIEVMSTEERWTFWKEQLGRCIRCYACRSACPMCYCDECVVDTINFVVEPDTSAEEKAQKIKWIEKSPTDSENFVYHLVRAMHLAGRCIDCGECERVCPLDIPIRFLNKKLEKEAKKLFDYEVGFDPEIPSLVSSFKDEDPEDFIR